MSMHWFCCFIGDPVATHSQAHGPDCLFFLEMRISWVLLTLLLICEMPRVYSDV